MVGQIHADGLAKLAADGEIVAVGAGDPSAAARQAADHNCAFAFLTADPLEVIAHPDVEAVMICAPTSAHPELVRAAVAARKPLLCEKPLARTFAEVRAICAEVAASGLTAQVGFHTRFHPLVAKLRDVVRSGELGAPMAYTLRDDQYWPTGAVEPGYSSWRSQRAQAGGGALIEHTIHGADIVSWLFGRARRVHGFGRSVFGYDVEDVAALAVEHESGVAGTIVTVFNAVRGREERRLEVFFERGVVEMTTDFVVGAGEDGFLVQRPDSPPERLDPAALREAHFDALGITRRDFIFYTYVADRQWVRSVQAAGDASPGFADALAAHALVEAAYRSMEAGTAADAR
jgi:predicted dehydrogenase